VTIGWTVTNLGTGPGTVANWVDSIIASPDGDPAHGSVIKQFTHQGALPVGGSYNESQTFFLPAGFQTHAHLFVKTDATDVVFENGNEANNAAEAPNLFDVALFPYADLTVSHVQTSTTAGSGQPLQVSWTVTNQAPNAIGTTNVSSWVDAVYLASDPAGNNIVANLGQFDHSGALAVGGSYSRSVTTLPLPDGLTGTFFPIVKTSGPYEFLYFDNNKGVGNQVTITPIPSPDLTPTSVVATTPGSTAQLTTATAGAKIDITWSVSNVGQGEAHGVWFDTLSLQEVGGSRVFGLGTFDYAAPLQGGRSYTRTEQVQLPTRVSGVFRLVARTNAGQFPIFENGATANNSFADPNTLTLTLPASPDLQVFSITNAPATVNAGATLDIDFSVVNQGTAEARGQWQDTVYISLKNVLDASAISLGSFGNQSALVPGQQYQTHAGNLLIPK